MSTPITPSSLIDASALSEMIHNKNIPEREKAKAVAIKFEEILFVKPLLKEAFKDTQEGYGFMNVDIMAQAMSGNGKKSPFGIAHVMQAELYDDSKEK